MLYASSSTSVWVAFLCNVGDVYKVKLHNIVDNPNTVNVAKLLDEDSVGYTLHLLLLRTSVSAGHVIHMTQRCTSALELHAREDTIIEIELCVQRHISKSSDVLRKRFNVSQTTNETVPSPAELRKQHAVDVFTYVQLDRRPAGPQARKSAMHS